MRDAAAIDAAFDAFRRCIIQRSFWSRVRGLTNLDFGPLLVLELWRLKKGFRDEARLWIRKCSARFGALEKEMLRFLTGIHG